MMPRTFQCGVVTFRNLSALSEHRLAAVLLYYDGLYQTSLRLRRKLDLSKDVLNAIASSGGNQPNLTEPQLVLSI